MNIVPHAPNIQYSSINQTTDALRQENRVREPIPPTSEIKQYPAEKPISENDRLRNQASSPELKEQENQQQVELQRTTINEQNSEQQGQQGKNEQETAQENPSAQARENSSETREGDSSNTTDGNSPTPEELQREAIINELKARDKEVRAHEQTHASVGGTYTGSPNLVFEKGPDGKNYAVGGHVSVDLSTISGDPKATITKMQRIRQAALAPASPSVQDQKVAATAQRIIAQQQMLVMDSDSTYSRTSNSVQSASNQRLTGVEEAVFGSNDSGPSVNTRAVRIDNFYASVSRTNQTNFNLTV